MAVTHIPSHVATGVFNHVDKPWESFAGRESGGPRSKGEPTDVWDSGGSPTDDPYRGLTPPISPAQVRGKADGKGERGRCLDQTRASAGWVEARGFEAPADSSACLHHGRREKRINLQYSLPVTTRGFRSAVLVQKTHQAICYTWVRWFSCGSRNVLEVEYLVVLCCAPILLDETFCDRYPSILATPSRRH